MTLVELQIASAISVILFAAVLTLAFYTARSFAAFTNYVDLDANSRNALDVMSTEIRQADLLKAATATSLTFQTTDLSTGATHASVAPRSAVHSSRVRSLNTRAKAARSSGHRERSH